MQITETENHAPLYVYFLCPMWDYTAGHRAIASSVAAAVQLFAQNSPGPVIYIPVHSEGMLRLVVSTIPRRLEREPDAQVLIIMDYPAHTTLSHIRPLLEPEIRRQQIGIVYLCMYHADVDALYTDEKLAEYRGKFGKLLAQIDFAIDLEPYASHTLPCIVRAIPFTIPLIRRVPYPNTSDTSRMQRVAGRIVMATGGIHEAQYLQSAGRTGIEAVQPSAYDMRLSDSRVALRHTRGVQMSGGYSTSWELWSVGTAAQRLSQLLELSRPVEDVSLRRRILMATAVDTPHGDLTDQLPEQPIGLAYQLAVACERLFGRVAWATTMHAMSFIYNGAMTPELKTALHAVSATAAIMLPTQRDIYLKEKPHDPNTNGGT